MYNRRDFLTLSGLGGGGLFLNTNDPQSPSDLLGLRSSANASFTVQELHDEIRDIPIDDTHCHPLTFDDSQTTPDDFVERLSLSAFPLHRYFPRGVYKEWKEGNILNKKSLDKKHDVVSIREHVLSHARETVFLHFLIKEMAEFLDCKPSLESVIEARNDQASDYGNYIKRLFLDGKIENVMLDLGYREGLTPEGVNRFESAISPSKGRRILRVDTILNELMKKNLNFEEIETQVMSQIEKGLDGNGNLGAPSYGMKSYLLPRLGLLKPLFERSVARSSWDNFRDKRMKDQVPGADTVDRDKRWLLMSDALRYLHSMALESCLDRNMPMQFHAGDGEAPGGIMRNQNPFLMEEMIRFERDGVMRLPKVILIHAGYPLVGQAAWLTHLYANCYFELSLATPLIHHGMLRLYLEVLEVVPLSKILFGSDAYHLPEFYWLAAKWGRRFLSEALGIYIERGILSKEEAISAAHMILNNNNRRLYNL